MERTSSQGRGMGGTEGGRRPTGVPPIPPPAAAMVPGQADQPDPEVVEKPSRRRFDAEYKLRILREADQCSATGQLGALLRREGLYSSHLTTWRQQRERGLLEAFAPRKRGRRAARRDPLAEENECLRRENERLTARLKQAETIIEFQKKVSEILGIPLKSPDNGGLDG